MKPSSLDKLSQQSAQATQWVLEWSDDFNGTTIDQTKWSYDTGSGGWNNAELQFYTNRTSNAFVQNGTLVLQANKENYGDSNYTSARLTTQGKFST